MSDKNTQAVETPIAWSIDHPKYGTCYRFSEAFNKAFPNAPVALTTHPAAPSAQPSDAADAVCKHCGDTGVIDESDDGQHATLCSEHTPPTAQRQEVERMDALVEAFNTWPADIRKKLSLHDLRRMTGWVPPPSAHGAGAAVEAVAWEVKYPNGQTSLNSQNPHLTEPGFSKRPLIYGDTQQRSEQVAALSKRDDGASFDFAAHLLRQRQWSSKTFGPGGRAQGVVDHIRKELLEIEADPGDLKEWVDVVILALDGAWRSDHTPQEIIDALVAKQTKNEGRTWPDWRTADPSKAIEHDRSADALHPEQVKDGETG